MMEFELTRIFENISKAIDSNLTLNQMSIENNVQSMYTKMHQFKVAHLSIHIAKKIGLTKEQIQDIYILGLMHDVGFISTEIIPIQIEKHFVIDYESILGHCIIGENLINFISFHSDVKNVIMYHHENYDGTGYFRIKGEEIPLFSRILMVANSIDLYFDLGTLDKNFDEILSFLRKESGKMLDPELIETTIDILKEHRKDNFYKKCDSIPVIKSDYSLKQVKEFASSIMNIIDSKSPYTATHSKTITHYVEMLANYYKLDYNTKTHLSIAANLHDLGKLSIPQSILEKPAKLLPSEFDRIKDHSRLGFSILSDVCGFENIRVWILQHHEKLNGTGYPDGLVESEIEYESQLITVCDIFVALTEDRPYRKRFTVKKAFIIMDSMIERNEINKQIYTDLKKIVLNKA